MNIAPFRNDTAVIDGTHEWMPNSCEGLLEELHHIKSFSGTDQSLLLYRGHRKRQWLLDSTFVRSFKKTLFELSPEQKLSRRIVESEEFHPAILNLFLLKFGVLQRPSEELESVAQEYGVDAWFEYMKRIQQYPEEDGFFLKGTNLIDWTRSPDIALYFANEKRDSEGVLYICDATATGKTLQILHLGEILDRMSELGKARSLLGRPLLFSPPKQIKCQRAKNQQAIYFAQMDLRYDLEHMWKSQEARQANAAIIIKMVLPGNSQSQVAAYLASRGITTEFVYPDIQECV